MPVTVGFTPLPLPDGSIQGAAYAISADGTTAVGYVCPAGDTDQRLACYWTNGTGPNLIGDNFTEAYGVSGDGSVIVGTAVTSDYQPFLWTAGGGMTSFGTLADRVYGISANGQKIVGTTQNLSNLEEACFWNRSFIRTDMGYLAGDDRSRAYSTTNDGTFITGHSLLNSDFPDSIRAFLWTVADMIDLGLPVDDPSVPVASRGFGVSNDGLIVVGDLEPTVPTIENGAFRWTVAGMIHLAAPSITSTATAISGDGTTIVGTAEYQSSGNKDLAYWTNEGNTVTVPPPPSFGDGQGSYPTGVSSNGSVMAGYTFGPNPLPFLFGPSSPPAPMLLVAPKQQPVSLPCVAPQCICIAPRSHAAGFFYGPRAALPRPVLGWSQFRFKGASR